MIKSILKKILPSPHKSAYHIGFVDKDQIIPNNTSWYKNVKWLNTKAFDKEGWFADPFFYEVNDSHIVLLAEQWYYPINRGRLAKLVINKKSMRLESVIPILTLDTHLSFPNIWREKEKTYIYPENFENGNLRIWEFDGETMTNPRTLINEPLLDSQILKIDNYYFVFGVIYNTGEWSDTKDLQIWRANNLFGPYTHIQTIHNNCNNERGAGIIINNEGHILRPAQNCNGFYGKETIMFELIFNGDCFEEKELYRITPNKQTKYGLVLHTYNEYDNLCVIDGLSYLYPLLHKMADIFK